MENEVKAKIIPIRELYYNSESNYGIYACSPVEGKIKLNSYDNASVKGNTVRLTLDQEYNAKLIEKQDKKYGTYYEIVSIFEDVPTDPKRQRDYLANLLTPNQVNAIFKAYPNDDVIELIKNDKIDLHKVKGIGKKTYIKIKEKIIQNLEFQQAYEFLSPFGVTNNLVIKLVKHFKSAKLLIQKMKTNPYSITVVSGIGFKKADAIAMSMGYNPKGEFRILSCIEYVVEEESNNGNTYVTTDKLVIQVQEIIDVESDLIIEQIKDTDSVIVVGDRVALKKNYNAEKYIAKRLKELMSKPIPLNFNPNTFIQGQEEKHSIQLTDQQKQLFTTIQNNRVSVLTGFAGCVDMETEYFNGHGWKKISEYQEGDYVLQYKEDGTAELVKPIAYHKLPETKMTLIKTDLGSINQCLSNNHTVVYRTSKGHLAKLPFSEVKKRHNEVPQGFYGRFYTFFNYSGEGIGLTDEEIRVMVMVIADGYFRNHTNVCDVRVKKERKKERVKVLLENANIPYTVKESVDNYLVYKFPAHLRLKQFDSTWYHCSQHQLQVICDEVLHWDGSIDKKGRQRFSSNVKESAEFIQFAFSATGHRATLYEQDRTGQQYKNAKYIRKTKEYGVHIAKNKWVSINARTQDKKTKLIEVAPKDGYKYCFTVPSEMWVMRREGRICVTGNCGKSQMLTLLIDLLEQLRISYRLLSPTGKAAKVISNYTKRSAETIHRAIGMGVEKTAQAQKFIDEEFVIVDEASMVDVQLCAKLLKKCENEKVRILFIGDPAQIPAVSAGNVLHDMLNSYVIPTTQLDNVFRQKEGGVLDIITKIRKNERFLTNDEWGIKKFGDNCIIACVPQEKMAGGYNYYFNEFLNELNSDEITIATPTKKGQLGTVEINKHIQDIVNTSEKGKKEKQTGMDKVTFREGDLVLNIKNTYEMLDVNENPVDIVNGDIGKVIKIDFEEEEVIVDFEFTQIPFTFSQLNQLLHCWSMTTHKLQGSSNTAIIVIADKSHKFQLNANLLYTACSRTTDKLVLISQAETINYAMRKKANLTRNTFLGEMLKEEEVILE